MISFGTQLPLVYFGQLWRVHKNWKNTVFLFIFRFRTWNHWKRFKINKKGWKRLKTSISTSFQVRAAPESCSKYSTTKTSFTFVCYLKINYLGNDGIGDCHRREPILMRKTSKVVPVIVRPDARQDLKTKVSEGLNTEQNWIPNFFKFGIRMVLLEHIVYVLE